MKIARGLRVFLKYVAIRSSLDEDKLLKIQISVQILNNGDILTLHGKEGVEWTWKKVSNEHEKKGVEWSAWWDRRYL